MHNQMLSSDHFIQNVHEFYKKNRVILLSSIVCGILAYMFAFTNKLVNHDEVYYLFGKGATVDSGRWGLEILRLVFPDYSMPWIYGILGITFLSISNCFIIRAFDVENTFLQVMLSGLMTTFAPIMATASYMFSFAPYCVAILSASASVFLIVKRGKTGLIISVLLAVFTLSIYQSYIAYIASLLLIALISRVLYYDISMKRFFQDAALFLLQLLLTCGIYLLLTLLILKLRKASLNTYASNSLALTPQRLLLGVHYAFEDCYQIIRFYKYGLFATETARDVFLALMGLNGLLLIANSVSNKTIRLLYSLPLFVLLPVFLNAIVLVSDQNHTLTFYSWSSLFVFTAISLTQTLKCLPEKLYRWKDFLNSGTLILLFVLLISNIYNSNRAYLRMHLAYERTYSYYSVLLSEIQQLPGYNGQETIALVGNGTNGVRYLTEMYDVDTPIGTGGISTSAYSREDFVRYYLGRDVSFATEEEIETIRQTNEFREMSEYPRSGSIRIIDGFIVVNFGESEIKESFGNR